MNNISANPLGRTQQAGQGTAFIYDPISNANPIDKLYGYVLNTTKQKAKAKAEKDKLLADKGADLRTEILKISDKIRQHDLPTAQKYQNEIFDWLKEQGGDAFDPMNPAFSELTNKLAQLNSFAAASQSLREQEKIAQSKYNANPNKYGHEEWNRLYENIFSKPTEYILQNADNPAFNINIKERLLTPNDVLNKSKYNIELRSFIKGFKTIQQDKPLTEDINKYLTEQKEDYIYKYQQDLIADRERGNIDANLTDNELYEVAKNHVEPLFTKVFHDPTTDEKQKFEEEKFKKQMELWWYKGRTGRISATKSQSNPTPFNTIEVFRSAGNGSPNALELIRSGLGEGETFEVIKGEDLIKNNINPNGLNPKAGKRYFKYFTKSGQKIWGDATDEDVLTKFSNGTIGKNLEAMASANKTSNLGMGGSKQNDIVVGTKTTNSSSSSSSSGSGSGSTKKTVNTKTNKTPNFKMK